MNEKIIKEIKKTKKKELKKLRKVQKDKIKISETGKLYCFACENVSGNLVDLKKHILYNHPEYLYNEVKDYIKRVEDKISPKIKSSEKFSKKEECFVVRGKFRIFSKRGTKIFGNFVCDVCRVTYSFGWKYKETSKGEVCICGNCKDKYKRGRLHYRQILPGSFESSS